MNHYYTLPCSVILELDDGETQEHVFATRFLAELFISNIPMMAVIMEEWAAVRSAILSPLVAPTPSPQSWQ
jgi:hypothetical protein